MALSTANIASGIAALSVSGVSIKGLSAIPVSPTDLGPVMFPDPSRFLGGYSGGPQTFGVATAYWEVARNLNYVYIHCPAGGGRDPFEFWSAITTNMDAIYEKLAELNVAGVDVMGVSMDEPGTIQAPDESLHIGCFVTITVRERLNA